jgi:hypothetical protein
MMLEESHSLDYLKHMSILEVTINYHITSASNLTPQVVRFFAKTKAQKSVQLAPHFMRALIFKDEYVDFY